MRMGDVESICKNLLQEVHDFEAKRKSELQKIYDEKKNVVETVKISFENRKKAIDNEIKIMQAKVYLTGILSYGCRNLTPCKVTVQLKENSNVVAEINTTLKVENTENSSIKVEFPYSLLLKKEVRYTVSMALNEALGKYFDYGAVGRSVVKCEGVCFKFEKVPNSSTKGIPWTNSRVNVFENVSNVSELNIKKVKYTKKAVKITRYNIYRT
ncbi:unnamed protein product [Mytilus coruscus]|uniref:PHR domain-containing protein n=1 Tax=Mytilus coruscus TaxID=42192 RepID=A0A6J8CP34_MYTCO|nr:unnamed protein product [Mytilus coruscus]